MCGVVTWERDHGDPGPLWGETLDTIVKIAIQHPRTFPNALEYRKQCGQNLMG